MKAVWLASAENDWPFEVISLGPGTVVASPKRALPVHVVPAPTTARPEGEAADGQTVAVAGKLWERTRPESTSSRNPSQDVASRPAATKARPEAKPCAGPGVR